MRYEKYLILGLLCLSFMMLVSAQDDFTSIPDKLYADYGDQVSFEVDNNEDTGPLYVEACGKLVYSSSDGSSRSTGTLDDYPYEVTFSIPQDSGAACPLGEHEININASQESSSGEPTTGTVDLEVYHNNQLSDETLFTSHNWVYSGTDQLAQWRIRPVSESGGNPSPGQVEIYFNPRGFTGGYRESYMAKTGVILSESGDLPTEDSGSSQRVRTLKQFMDVQFMGGTQDVAEIALDNGNWNSDPCDGRCLLGQKEGSYPKWQLNGEIIMGEGYNRGEEIQSSNVNGPTDIENAEIHHCYPGKGSKYDYVFSPGDRFDSDHFECDESTGEWQPSPRCEAGHIGKNSQDEIVAYYSNSEGECVSTPYEQWNWVNQGTPDEPKVYNCAESDNNCGGEVPTDDVPTNWPEQWSDAGEMPVVEYGSYRDHFEALLEDQQTAETGFVDAQEGWVTQYQPLHSAEQEYDPSGDGLTPGPWEEINITQEGIGTEQTGNKYYNNQTAANHYTGKEDSGTPQDAWITANAGTGKNGIYENSENFEGGFAGNCIPNFEWTYQGPNSQIEWRCDGEITQTSSIGSPDPVDVLPNFKTTAHLPWKNPEENNGVTTQEIGVTIFPFMNIAPENRPEYVPSEVTYYPEVSSGGGEITGVAKAGCWLGNLDQQPDDLASSDRAFIKQPNGLIKSINNDPVSIKGTVEKVDGFNGYSCYWEFGANDRTNNVRGEEGEVIHLHRQKNSNYWNGLETDFGLDDTQFLN